MNVKTKGKKKGNHQKQMRCPYCGAIARYRSADGIYKDNSGNTMLYVCSNYPECDSYVRVHKGTKIPVGSMANPQLRKLRREAHEHFDLLYQSGLMTKQEAYLWLADIVSSPLSEAHIGHLGEYYCKKVIEKSEELWAERQKRLAKYKVVGGER